MTSSQAKIRTLPPAGTGLASDHYQQVEVDREAHHPDGPVAQLLLPVGQGGLVVDLLVPTLQGASEAEGAQHQKHDPQHGKALYRLVA